jgi:predicted choloylglycine hydrolase
VRTYVVDYQDGISVISDGWIIRNTIKLIEKSSNWYGAGLTKFAFKAARLLPNIPYKGEIIETARMNGISVGDLMYGNLIFESSSVAQKEWCSSGAVFVDGKMRHLRNLDWDIEGLDKSVICVEYMNCPAGDFRSLTFPGYSGVITGIGAGRFSISLNMLITEGGLDLGGAPISHIMRQALEECRSFTEAVKFVSGSRCMAPGLVHIVGLRASESAVIQMGEGRNTIHYVTSITNHSLSESNVDEEYGTDSEKRLRCMERIVTQRSFAKIKSGLHRFPLMNSGTVFSKILTPETGEIE